MAGIGIAPTRLPAGCVDTLHYLFIAQAMVENQVSAADRGRPITGADRFLPKERRTVSRPSMQQTGLPRDPVAQRPEKTGPIFARRLAAVCSTQRDQSESQQKEECLTAQKPGPLVFV